LASVTGEDVNAFQMFSVPPVTSSTIDWGDGTASAGGLLSQAEAAGFPIGSPGFDPTIFVVTGGHIYDNDGIYTVKVTVTSTTSRGTVVTNNTVTAFVTEEELKPDGTRGTPTERFVQEVYRDLLGRGLDPV